MANYCDPCRFRHKKAKAKYFCHTCMEYYCGRCRKQHLKFRLTMGHYVSDVKQGQDMLTNKTTETKGRDINRYGSEKVDSNAEVYDYEAEILETDSSRQNHLSGKCIVRVDSCGISITEPKRHVTIFWPYTCIRKYGSTENRIFYFECGRQCLTGEGRYVLMAQKAIALHKNMIYFIRRVLQQT